MKEIFISKSQARVRPYDIMVNRHYSVKFGDKSMFTKGPKIWNTLPEKIKSETSYKKFKDYIDSWFGPECKCTSCKALLI